MNNNMLWVAFAAAAMLSSAACSDDDTTPGQEICGDGVITSSEACDDGNTTAGDGCGAACEVEHGYVCLGEPSYCQTSCGDGLLAGTESCDDGNNYAGDGCTVHCAIENGYVCTGEPSQCIEDCGDEQIVGNENCDDGNADAGDGCSDSCRIEDGWECVGLPSVCQGVCGDGFVVENDCDDGNLEPGDGCDATCIVEPGWECTGEPSLCAPICGDGVLVGNEPCDDAGESATCDADCTPAGCGDSTVNVTAGEECDEGGETINCDDDCSLVSCGDGQVNAAASEECDDGANTDGDGCSAACTIEPGYICTGEPSYCLINCGDGIVTGHEECDDSGESATCDDDCTFVVCGDGNLNVTAGEECDDGNTQPGDGCDANCISEFCTGTITTTFSANNSQAGNMFDVVALGSIMIDSFDVNIDAGTHTVEVWHRSGSYVGFTGSSAGWTQVANVTGVVSTASNVATPLNLNLHINVAAGQTAAFYITATTAVMNYTNGSTEGAVYVSNSDLQVLEGIGVGYQFSGTFSPRIWNGNIIYCP